jgi:hypothetical protein
MSKSGKPATSMQIACRNRGAHASHISFFGKNSRKTKNCLIADIAATACKVDELRRGCYFVLNR